MNKEGLQNFNPTAESYTIGQYSEREDHTYIERDRVLPSGNILRKQEWLVDENTSDRSYSVLKESGETVNMSFTVLEMPDWPFTFSAGWIRESSLPVVLESANDYFEAISEARGSELAEVGIQTATEYSDGDHIEIGVVPFPVTTTDVAYVAEQHGEYFSSVDDIRISAPGGTIVDSGNYLRVKPSHSDKTDGLEVSEALQEIFKATTKDVALIPVFREALDAVVAEEALW